MLGHHQSEQQVQQVRHPFEPAHDEPATAKSESSREPYSAITLPRSMSHNRAEHAGRLVPAWSSGSRGSVGQWVSGVQLSVALCERGNQKDEVRDDQTSSKDRSPLLNRCSELTAP